MKICDLFEMLDEVQPSAISERTKLRLLSECENSILTNTYLLAAENCIEYTAVTDAELLVPHPYDKLYLPYLQAQLCYLAGEYAQYENHMQLYNTYRDELAVYLLSAVHPGNGKAMEETTE